MTTTHPVALIKGSRRGIGIPEDIGKAVAYLASDDADYATGSVLRVDGGLMVGLS